MIPLHATGLLGLRGPSPAFLGTAFAYRDGQHFLTAAHCVGDAESTALSLAVPASGRVWPVAEVDRHPSADVALIKLEQDVPSVEPFGLVVSNLSLAEEFYAFGYPENVLGFDERQPTPRIFVGHFQRYFWNRAFGRFEYEAAEMSIPAPPGLSGGPLSRPQAPSVVTGVVVDNLDSTELLDAVEDITSGGEKRTIQYQRVISYGVGVLLHPLSEWLEARVPSHEAYSERLRVRRERSE